MVEYSIISCPYVFDTLAIDPSTYRPPLIPSHLSQILVADLNVKVKYNHIDVSTVKSYKISRYRAMSYSYEYKTRTLQIHIKYNKIYKSDNKTYKSEVKKNRYNTYFIIFQTDCFLRHSLQSPASIRGKFRAASCWATVSAFQNFLLSWYVEELKGTPGKT
jgi:hypothetical protein